ncbi:HU family DNA-binding protein [Reinekea sp. G2M2-21]|uniref:HU family DNA-binding protein n=1 Tax=Reinekea sp. G2M2-21 TaxID=2788942 RepID=UPI0018A890FE|nr:HU family DNA-binding protein [Reinekea sp. G2M2-21]
MNKGELISAVATGSELTKTDAERAVNAVIDTITKALVDGESVTLIGFGSFDVSTRAARTGRNPQTGQPIEISESIVPRFKAGKALKVAVNL